MIHVYSCIEKFFGVGPFLLQILRIWIRLVLPEDKGRGGAYPRRMDRPGGDGEDEGKVVMNEWRGIRVFLAEPMVSFPILYTEKNYNRSNLHSA